MKRKDIIDALLLAAFLIFIVLLALRKIVFGSEPGNWVYMYVQAFSPAPIIISIIVALIACTLVYFSLKHIKKHEYKILVLWLIAAFICQGMLFSLQPFSIEQIVESKSANGYYAYTQTHTAYESLNQERSPLHIETNMPGKMLLYELLNGFSPKAIGYIIMFLSNIGALLLYFILKKISKNDLPLYAFILYLFIPSKIIFTPILNVISPIFILLSLFLFMQYLETKKNLYSILLGISLYLVVFFEPTTLALGIIFLAFLNKKINYLQLIGYTLASFLITHMLMFLIFGFNFLTKLIIIAQVNKTELLTRPYSIWLYENIRNFFMSAGILPSILFICAIVSIIYKKKITTLTKIIIATMITLLILNISGIFGGEVARLWIFLAPFIQVAAAYFIIEKLTKRTFYLTLITLIVQTAIMISMVGFVIPFHLIPLT